MKKCQKINCENPSITKGKYCDSHRSKKKPINERKSVVESKLFYEHEPEYKTEYKSEYNRKIAEDRALIDEQTKEYSEAKEADREKMEMDKMLELSKKEYLNKMNDILNEPEDINNENYNIKICFPDGKKIIRKFNEYDTLENIRKYIDAYIHINNYNIINYNLVINIPIKKYTINDNYMILKECFTCKNFNLFIENIDS